MTAQLIDELPVSFDHSPEGAFGHAVTLDERLDFLQNGVLFHDPDLSRVITRTSTPYAGIYTILRGQPRAAIIRGMGPEAKIDIEKLEADMAACVERTSGRSFSLKATGGKNPDFYRNWTKNGQNKRLSADVFAGIVTALGRDPGDYIVGWTAAARLPSATVLTSAMAALLETVGVDPFEDERAQKLARRFPDALRRFSTLHEGLTEDSDSPHEEAPLDRGEDRPAA